MIVRKLRLQRGWSQEQLAEMSGLSVRTVQRIERGQTAGLESLKSLAAVFDVDFQQLRREAPMSNHSTAQPTTTELSSEEAKALEYVRDIKAFYRNLASYLVIIPALAAFDIIRTPDHLWFYWPALGWGIGLISHGLSVFEVFHMFSADWERKQVEKRLHRKL